jgi:hypothetical protein
MFGVFFVLFAGIVNLWLEKGVELFGKKLILTTF